MKLKPRKIKLVLHDEKIEQKPTEREKPKNEDHPTDRARAKRRRTISDYLPPDTPKEEWTAVGKSMSILRHKIDDEPKLARVVKTSWVLSDAITDKDKEVAIRTIRECLNADCRFYDTKTKSSKMVPDHRTRLAAATLLLAYTEGMPVKRHVVATTSFESGEDVLSRVSQSPTALAILGATPGPVIEMDVQKTGGGNPIVASIEADDENGDS